MKTAWILLLAFIGVQGTAAQEKASEPAVDFAAITARGRALFAYDQAAWHGTDAIFALKPDTRGLTHYICNKTPSGWVVIFPQWNESHDQLLAIYEAREKDGKFAARKLPRPVAVEADLLSKERALELAIADFPKPNRPYNTAILPAPGNQFFVYLYPGQTTENTWPIGGDMRYTISADGKNILEKRKLHNAVQDMKIGDRQVGGYHTHAISDIPEDTDVFYVLNRKPSIPEFVGTSKQMYVVDKQGNIETGKD